MSAPAGGRTLLPIPVVEESFFQEFSSKTPSSKKRRSVLLSSARSGKAALLLLLPWSLIRLYDYASGALMVVASSCALTQRRLQRRLPLRLRSHFFSAAKMHRCEEIGRSCRTAQRVAAVLRVGCSGPVGRPTVAAAACIRGSRRCGLWVTACVRAAPRDSFVRPRGAGRHRPLPLPMLLLLPPPPVSAAMSPLLLRLLQWWTGLGRPLFGWRPTRPHRCVTGPSGPQRRRCDVLN